MAHVVSSDPPLRRSQSTRLGLGHRYGPLITRLLRPALEFRYPGGSGWCGERCHFSAADPYQVIAGHRDRVGPGAGVEIDDLNLEQAAIVNRAEAEEKSEWRNSALAQAGSLRSSSSVAKRAPLPPTSGASSFQFTLRSPARTARTNPALRLHEHRLGT